MGMTGRRRNCEDTRDGQKEQEFARGTASRGEGATVSQECREGARAHCRVGGASSSFWRLCQAIRSSQSAGAEMAALLGGAWPEVRLRPKERPNNRVGGAFCDILLQHSRCGKCNWS